jgi:hypothetical protein
MFHKVSWLDGLVDVINSKKGPTSTSTDFTTAVASGSDSGGFDSSSIRIIGLSVRGLGESYYVLNGTSARIIRVIRLSFVPSPPSYCSRDFRKLFFRVFNSQLGRTQPAGTRQRHVVAHVKSVARKKAE